MVERTLNQSLSEVIINQSNSLITFDTQLKTGLYHWISCPSREVITSEGSRADGGTKGKNFGVLKDQAKSCEIIFQGNGEIAFVFSPVYYS